MILKFNWPFGITIQILHTCCNNVTSILDTVYLRHHHPFYIQQISTEIQLDSEKWIVIVTLTWTPTGAGWLLERTSTFSLSIKLLFVARVYFLVRLLTEWLWQLDQCDGAGLGSEPELSPSANHRARWLLRALSLVQRVPYRWKAECSDQSGYHGTGPAPLAR